MDTREFNNNVKKLFEEHKKLTSRPNKKQEQGNGIFDRYVYPVITNLHTPVYWRYDLNPDSNPHLMVRQGVNAAFNVGAIELYRKIYLAVRVEGWDRKSFFAITESDNGIDNFKF